MWNENQQKDVLFRKGGQKQNVQKGEVLSKIRLYWFAPIRKVVAQTWENVLAFEGPGHIGSVFFNVQSSKILAEILCASDKHRATNAAATVPTAGRGSHELYA